MWRDTYTWYTCVDNIPGTYRFLQFKKKLHATNSWILKSHVLNLWHTRIQYRGNRLWENKMYWATYEHTVEIQITIKDAYIYRSLIKNNGSKLRCLVCKHCGYSVMILGGLIKKLVSLFSEHVHNYTTVRYKYPEFWTAPVLRAWVRMRAYIRAARQRNKFRGMRI